MEHLARPRSPAEDQFHVPYIGMKAYDCGLFLEYPEREGWHKAVELLAQSTHGNVQADWIRLTAFLQRWLFFGLLHSFFQDSYNELDYIHRDSHGEAFLTTASLNERLLSLKELELSKPDNWKSRLRARDDCLQTAKKILIGLPSKAAQIDGRVLLSLLVLTETLSAVNMSDQIAAAEWPTEARLKEGTKLLQALRRDAWQEPLPEEIRDKVVAAVTTAMLEERLQGPDEVNVFIYEIGTMMQRYEGPAVGLPGSMVQILQDRLQARGWCPREVQMITQQFGATLQLYISQLDRPGKLKDHQRKGCEPQECRAYHISTHDYRTEHAEHDCSCENVSIDTNRVFEILQKNKVPVVFVEFQKDGSLRLNVVESDGDVEYIALSHVWSDDLGNNHENALPRCQILRVYGYSCQARSAVLPFWIDTLCCPRNPPQARALAIRLMRKTYEEAAVVVVIDAWLREHSSQYSSNVESMLRIALSGWTRRLWTFQEGSINKNVSVVFCDKIVDLDSLAENIKFCDHPSMLPMTRDLLAVHEELRTLHLSDSHSTREKFRRLLPCLRYRGTSWASDEPICLAIIFGLHADRVWEATGEHRMKEFWNALEDVPPDVVFFDAPKCPQGGFRWAPSTLFGGKHNQAFSNVHGYGSAMPPARKTPDGLVISLPGFMLSKDLNERFSQDRQQLFEFQDQHSYRYWMRQVPTAEGALPDQLAGGEGRRFAIVYIGFPTGSWQLALSPAILVANSSPGGNENAFSKTTFVQYMLLCRAPGVPEAALPYAEKLEVRDWCID